MVIFGRWQNQTLSLSFKPNSFTLSLQDAGGPEAHSQVLSFDGEGRLWTAMLDGVAYRRGLNGRSVAKWQVGATGRERRWLTDEECARLEARSRQTALELVAGLETGAAALPTPLDPSGAAWLERAACYDAARYQADVQRYHQVYKPVGILPPDQYMAVVLQATEGCSFNTCTFCNFYHDRPFRILKPEAFRTHCLAVRDYLGAGLSLRRTIFLGDANALVVPQARLLALLDVVHEVFDVAQLGGIYAFLDGFSGEKKSVADYAALACRGMKRVYIGLESGNAELLRFLKKPGQPEDAIQAVKAIKDGGLAVGVIVLAGAGGQQYARDHVRDSIAALNAMQLGMDDLVYFSELIESEGMQYTRDAYDRRLRPLSSAQRIAQAEAIEAGLQFSEDGGVPHISRYDIREFVY